MRNILNLIITFVVFWIGNQYFSEYIHMRDMKTVILAAVFMFIMSYLFSWLMVLSIFLIPIGIGCVTTAILFALAFVLTPIKLLILNNYLEGFQINGFWTYVVLTVIFTIFSVKVKSTNTTTTTTTK